VNKKPTFMTHEVKDRNVIVVTKQKDKYDLEVYECTTCGFHIGIDVSYLEQRGDIRLNCPSCDDELFFAGCDEP